MYIGCPCFAHFQVYPSHEVHLQPIVPCDFIGLWIDASVERSRDKTTMSCLYYKLRSVVSLFKNLAGFMGFWKIEEVLLLKWVQVITEFVLEKVELLKKYFCPVVFLLITKSCFMGCCLIVFFFSFHLICLFFFLVKHARVAEGFVASEEILKSNKAKLEIVTRTCMLCFSGPCYHCCVKGQLLWTQQVHSGAHFRCPIQTLPLSKWKLHLKLYTRMCPIDHYTFDFSCQRLLGLGGEKD